MNWKQKNGTACVCFILGYTLVVTKQKDHTSLLIYTANGLENVFEHDSVEQCKKAARDWVFEKLLSVYLEMSLGVAYGPDTQNFRADT
jgi:hypothetical protein